MRDRGPTPPLGTHPRWGTHPTPGDPAPHGDPSRPRGPTPARGSPPARGTHRCPGDPPSAGGCSPAAAGAGSPPPAAATNSAQLGEGWACVLDQGARSKRSKTGAEKSSSEFQNQSLAGAAGGGSSLVAAYSGEPYKPPPSPGPATLPGRPAARPGDAALSSPAPTQGTAAGMSADSQVILVGGGSTLGCCSVPGHGAASASPGFWGALRRL